MDIIDKYLALMAYAEEMCRCSRFSSSLEAAEICNEAIARNADAGLPELKKLAEKIKNEFITDYKKIHRTPVMYKNQTAANNAYIRKRCAEDPAYSLKLKKQKSDSAKKQRLLNGEVHQRNLARRRNTSANWRLIRRSPGPIRCDRAINKQCHRLPSNSKYRHNVCPLPLAHEKIKGMCHKR